MSKSAQKQNPALVGVALVVTGFGIGWLAGLSISPVVSILITSVTGIAAAIVTALSGLKEEPPDDQISDKAQKNTKKEAATQIQPPNELEKPEPARRHWRWQVDPIPIALLMAGLIVGTTTGIYVRNHNLLGVDDKTTLNVKVDKGWLGGDLQTEIDLWVTAGELDRKLVAQRLLESTYPLNSLPAAQPKLTEEQRKDFDIVGFTTLKAAEAMTQAPPICNFAKDNTGGALRKYISQTITNTKILSLTTVITGDDTLKGVVHILCTAG